MRLYIAVLLSLMSTTRNAYGAVQTPLRGTTTAGEAFYAEEVYWDPALKHPYRWKITTASGVFEKQPCGTNFKNELTFWCAPEGSSPLAGTTYVFRKYLTKCGGTLLICKEGCSSRVPNALIEEPYECGDPENPELPSCAGSDHGFISGEAVNVREKPSTVAPVIQRLAKNTKVKILETSGACIVIDHERGIWVKVKTENGTAVQEGWVFDAYIRYISPQ